MEDKVLEILTQMYSDLNGKMDKMQGQMDNMQDKMGNMQGQIGNIHTDLNELKKIVLRIETDHGNKLDALFDGHKQNSDRLDRIEAQVSKQEEFIIQRVK